jgi:hypothetical protein
MLDIEVETNDASTSSRDRVKELAVLFIQSGVT